MKEEIQKALTFRIEEFRGRLQELKKLDPDLSEENLIHEYIYGDGLRRQGLENELRMRPRPKRPEHQVTNEAERQFLDWLYDRKAQLEPRQTPNADTKANTATNKIQWLGSPAHLGYVMILLAEKGFIQIPDGENATAYARQILNGFDIRSSRTKGQVSIDTMRQRLNPNKCPISDKNADKFRIPDIREL